jgi:hypothetical protein
MSAPVMQVLPGSTWQSRYYSTRDDILTVIALSPPDSNDPDHPMEVSYRWDEFNPDTEFYLPLNFFLDLFVEIIN